MYLSKASMLEKGRGAVKSLNSQWRARPPARTNCDIGRSWKTTVPLESLCNPLGGVLGGGGFKFNVLHDKVCHIQVAVRSEVVVNLRNAWHARSPSANLEMYCCVSYWGYRDP